MDLLNKVTLITGSSRGIGRATALLMGNRGAKLAVTYLQSQTDAESLVNELTSSGTEAHSYLADVSDQSSVDRLVSEVIHDFGRIDILVNNAGAIPRPSAWDQQNEELFDRTIAINLKGTYHCARSVAPLMVRQESGRIINISTTYALTGAAPIAAYSAAKAGVINLTKSLAKELAPYVTVNAVAPGNIDTEMTRQAGQEIIDWAIGTTPLMRLGRPEEVAEAVAFLAMADFITGHVLVVDGGQIINVP